MPQTVNLAEKLARITDHWQPRLAASLNGQEVRLAKLKGRFIWHRHDDADELFLVLSGRLRIDLRDAAGALDPLELGPGELAVVPRGLEHRPVADDEVAVLLFEPAGTSSTGGLDDPRRVDAPPPV